MKRLNTVMAGCKGQRLAGIVLLSFWSSVISAEFVALTSIDQLPMGQLPAYAQANPSLRKPLPPSPLPAYKSPTPNLKLGFILVDNTPVKLKFKETITSKTAEENRPIEFEVSDDIVVQGVTVIAKGSTAKGIISEVKRARMLGRKGKISIILKEVALASGEQVALRASQSQGGGLSVGTIALSAIVAPVFLLMGGKEAKYTAGTEFTAFVDGNYALDRSKFR